MRGIKCICPWCGHKCYSLGKITFPCPKCSFTLSIGSDYDRNARMKYATEIVKE